MWGEVNEEMKIRIQYNSPVVITFAFLSLFALLADEVSGGWTNQHIFSVYRAPLSDPLTYARAFLHVLGHTDWEHYSNNILLMLVIGPQLEEKYGSKTLLLCISVTALVTGLVQCLLFPNAALLGASGILFMMLLMASSISVGQLLPCSGRYIASVSLRTCLHIASASIISADSQ